MNVVHGNDDPAGDIRRYTLALYGPIVRRFAKPFLVHVEIFFVNFVKLVSHLSATLTNGVEQFPRRRR